MNCIILCHGQLAQSLFDTARKITGDIENVVCLSNENLSVLDIEELLSDKINSFDTTTDILIFVGIKGGSCWNAALKTAKKHKNIHVISGVNLPMFITFCTNRDRLSLNELLEKIINSGRTGIDINSSI